MNFWLIPSNQKRFRLNDYFDDREIVDWKQGRYKFQIGDMGFIYCSLPEACIKYIVKIEKINIPYEDSIDDEEYWGDRHEFSQGIKENKYCRMRLIGKIKSDNLSLASLLGHGLNKAPQGCMFVNDELLNYLTDVLNTDYELNPNNESNFIEGKCIQITSNKYERNPLARARCIALKGTSCSICNFNFEEKYGEVGKDFIHIHHIMPISCIGHEYQLDIERDLIPVCPNCHAMLHRVINGQTLTVEELMRIIH